METPGEKSVCSTDEEINQEDDSVKLNHHAVNKTISCHPSNDATASKHPPPPPPPPISNMADSEMDRNDCNSLQTSCHVQMAFKQKSCCDDVTSEEHVTESRDPCTNSHSSENDGRNDVCCDKCEISEESRTDCDSADAKVLRTNNGRAMDDVVSEIEAEPATAGLLEDIMDFFEGGEDVCTVSSEDADRSPEANMDRKESNSEVLLPNGIHPKQSNSLDYYSKLNDVALLPSSTSFNADDCGTSNKSPLLNSLSTTNGAASEIPCQNDIGTASSCSSVSENPVLQQETGTDNMVGTLNRRRSSCAVSENPADDELLAELENEFYSASDVGASVVISTVECFPEYKSLQSRFDALQRRLEHTLGQRKQLEVENARLEQKLAAAGRNAEDMKAELELVIKGHEDETGDLKEKLTTLEAKSIQDLADLQNDHRLRVEQLTKVYEDCAREKDHAVVRYAQAEQKNIDLQDKLQKAETRVKEWTKKKKVPTATLR